MERKKGFGISSGIPLKLSFEYSLKVKVQSVIEVVCVCQLEILECSGA